MRPIDDLDPARHQLDIQTNIVQGDSALGIDRARYLAASPNIPASPPAIAAVGGSFLARLRRAAPTFTNSASSMGTARVPSSEPHPSQGTAVILRATSYMGRRRWNEEAEERTDSVSLAVLEV
jgi:hypothetical protein